MSGVAVVTGTRKGIGKAISEHFLAQGWRVAGCSRRDGSIDHPNYSHFPLDVADDAAVAGMVREVKKAWERIDVLINNAGVASMNHLLLTPMKSARGVVETNFLGTFAFMREVGKVMSRQKSGRIVNFSTVAVALDLEGEAIYAASKAAVEKLTRIGSKELGAYGVTVNAVAPTPVPTDLIRLVPKDKIQGLLDRQAIRRMGEVRDILNVIDFFVRPESDFVTGQVIYLGGVHD